MILYLCITITLTPDMKLRNFLLATAAASVLAACSHLSDEAKEMIGVYYIPEISATTPQLELNSDGSCVVHAMRSGQISYQVNGEWNVVNDSLQLTLHPDEISWEGDSTQIGHIPDRLRYKIRDFNGVTLTLLKNNLPYVYFRRGTTEE